MRHKTPEKLVGYIRAPRQFPDDHLDNFKVFTPEQRKKDGQYFWTTDPVAIYWYGIHGINGWTMIDYEVRQKEDSEDIIYRPANLLQRVLRGIFKNRVEFAEEEPNDDQ